MLSYKLNICASCRASLSRQLHVSSVTSRSRSAAARARREIVPTPKDVMRAQSSHRPTDFQKKPFNRSKPIRLDVVVPPSQMPPDFEERLSSALSDWVGHPKTT